MERTPGERAKTLCRMATIPRMRHLSAFALENGVLFNEIRRMSHLTRARSARLLWAGEAMFWYARDSASHALPTCGWVVPISRSSASTCASIFVSVSTLASLRGTAVINTRKLTYKPRLAALLSTYVAI